MYKSHRAILVIPSLLVLPAEAMGDCTANGQACADEQGSAASLLLQKKVVRTKELVGSEDHALEAGKSGHSSHEDVAHRSKRLRTRRTTANASEKFFPSDYFTCPQEQNLQAGQDNVLYRSVVKKVWQKSKQYRMNFDACIVRTAGHDLMDFRFTSDGTATGGSDGCINFGDDDNKGLPSCLVEFAVPDLYQQVCERVSLADFYVIAAEAVMARRFPKFLWADRFKNFTLEGKFMNNFRFGRATMKRCEDHVGLMPNAEEGCYDLKRIFVDHIYLHRDKQRSWRFTAAISGVHTLGGAHPENSGYNGTWTFDPSVFNNAYFKRLLDQGWGP
eukprot:CAMPEP_0117482516 /NCGR_PEP_ID=MMETSP0784-20121206/13460_1 /TAXON_ID=39447 /ORGANISM="" /LENGTH=330 /DNA_ID=CAMNT_0005277015 /DNA_START=252 /DNA_END=1241 /DNA_ORIENTATION=-